MLLTFCVSLLYPQKSLTLPELLDPRQMLVDGNQVIVSDYPNLYIYSLKDFRLLKKFGRAGEGPGEFYIPVNNRNIKDRGLVFSACGEHIVVYSNNRLSFFNRDGEFVKLTRFSFNINSRLLTLGEKALGLILKNGMLSAYILNPDMGKQVKLMESDYWLRFDKEERWNFFDQHSDTLLVSVDGGKIFLARGDSPKLSIQAFDINGKHLYTIKHDTQQVKIPKSFIERLHEHCKIKYRPYDEDVIKNLNLPEHFPAMRSIQAVDGKLYVITFKEQTGKTEVMLFDASNGKYRESSFHPVRERSPERLFPYSFREGKFYQLIENAEQETWQLSIEPVH